MADVHTTAQRSYNMSRIKGKNTKPEMLVRKFLYASGFRYRLHLKTLPGKPDIVFKKLNTVIFVHGCFWHGHEGCKYFKIPETRKDWWLEKINRNKELDTLNVKMLMQNGWKVIEIFECSLRKTKQEETLQSLLNNLNNSKAELQQEKFK
jgi:DNA mismatch endonuclease (patch repair protein)